MSPVRGDAKVPGSETPGVDREVCVEAGWSKYTVRSMKRSLQRRHFARVTGNQRVPSLYLRGEGHGRHLRTWSGCRGTLRRKGAWNVYTVAVGTGEALLGPRPAGMRSAPAYNRRTREVAGSREGVGGGRRSAGIKTGMEEEMEELYIEGLANHDDPGHALSLARVMAKRWTGARAGRAIEPRNHRVRGADVVYGNGRQHRQQRYRELLADPARSENHGMHGTSMRENREVSCSPVRLIAGRAAQGRSRPYA